MPNFDSQNAHSLNADSLYADSPKTDSPNVNMPNKELKMTIIPYARTTVDKLHLTAITAAVFTRITIFDDV